MLTLKECLSYKALKVTTKIFLLVHTTQLARRIKWQIKRANFTSTITICDMNVFALACKTTTNVCRWVESRATLESLKLSSIGWIQENANERSKTIKATSTSFFTMLSRLLRPLYLHRHKPRHPKKSCSSNLKTLARKSLERLR